MDNKEAIETIKSNWPNGRVMLQEALTKAISALRIEEHIEKLQRNPIGYEEDYDKVVYRNALKDLKIKIRLKVKDNGIRNEH